MKNCSYRTREEVENIRNTRDPILLLRSRILTSNLATNDELKSVEKQAKDEVIQKKTCSIL